MKLIKTDLARNILKDKYLNDGEKTYTDVIKRVTDVINQVDPVSRVDLYSMMCKGRYIFGGRIMAGAGLNDSRKVSMSNCYVLEPVEDNLESIGQRNYECMKTFSRGGGVGLDLSKLSPKGAKLNNAARSTTGAASYADYYSNAADKISQEGRRGALMVSLHCTHPDLENFIDLKSDLTVATKANLSIRFTNEFLEAVKNRKPFKLEFTREETGENITKIVDAYTVFKKFCTLNWQYGEPGALFWDTIEEYNMMSNHPEFEYAGVNPCFVGNTPITTVAGQENIADLVDKQPTVMCRNLCTGETSWRKTIRVWKSRENAELVKVVFSTYTDSGEKIKTDFVRCTPDHPFYVKGIWTNACHLENDMELIHKDELKTRVDYVEELPETEDVYDMSVDEHHNFYANGILVHNCAEEPLPAGGACLLGSLNWSKYTDWSVKPDSRTEWSMLAQDTARAVKALNIMLDYGIEKHPLDIQKESARNWRQIGLGDIGIADYLIKKGLTYGSPEAIEEVREVQNFIAMQAIKTSVEEAKEHGSFPMCDNKLLMTNNFINSVANKYLEYWPEGKDMVDEIFTDMSKYGIRNSQLLTIAPTGSISNLLSTSGGAEPNFSLMYERRTESLKTKDAKFYIVAPIVREYFIEVLGYSEDFEFTEADKEKLPDYFVTAHNIDKMGRIRMQAALQESIDASISSTINLPEESTVEDVINLYLEAYEHKLKGITIYRSGCARDAILTDMSSKKKKEKVSTPVEKPVDKFGKLNSIQPISRSSLGRTSGSTIDKKSACGKMYITINHDDAGNIVEVFVNTSKTGICASNMNAISRSISLMCRGGIVIDEIVDQLKSINCAACQRAISFGDEIDGISCPDILARTIIEEVQRLQEKYPNLEYKENMKAMKGIKVGKPPAMKRKKKVTVMPQEERESYNSGNYPSNEDLILKYKDIDEDQSVKLNICPNPDCRTELNRSNGCTSCPNCGWTKCSS